MGMNLAQGGHLTHGNPANFSGKQYKIVPYGLDTDTGLIDYDEMERIALETKPKMLIGGFSAYSRVKDWQRMREIADKVGAYFWVAMAHVDRTRVGSGKSVSVRVDFGGRRCIKKNNK